MAWLAGWTKRVRLTIDQNDIDAALADFPILVHLGTSVGRNGDDVSFVFGELQNNANRKKIAITTSDGETQCYVEIEKWDDASEKAWLWVKVPSIASSADTDLYLYYDKTHADNTAYVSDPNSTPAENVWDDNFKFVSHMRDDPDTSHIRDSTVNANDGTKKGAGEPAVTTDGKIDDAQNFDGENDYINIPSPVTSLPIGDSPRTFEAWFKVDDYVNYNVHFDYGEYVQGKRFVIYTSITSGALCIDLHLNTHITGITPPIGELHHFVATFSGTTTKAYWDGSYVSQKTDHIAPNTTATAVKIGINVLLSVGQYFDGIIDEVRISDIARTAEWIKASYESERDDLLDFGSEERGIVLTESLGLADKVVKAPSLVKKEPLGLLDTYSRTWAAHQTYSELLGLADTVSKGITQHPLTEALGLSDTVVKEPSKVLKESLGLKDLIIKDASVTRTELLGLADTITKDVSLPLSEILGLLDTTIKASSVIKVESLGLEDRLSKHPSKALTEVLGLLDSLAYSKNPTVLAKLIRKFIQLESIGGGGQN